MASSRLLELPTELLAHICDFIEKASLSDARLSCRLLQDAAFERWTKSFLSTRSVEATDVNSLYRLRNLVSIAGLARHMRNVDFSLDYSHFTLNQALLIRTLKDLKQANISVGLVLITLDGEELAPALLHCLLYAVLYSKCKVATISINHGVHIDPDLLDMAGELSFSDLAADLREFTYWPDADEVNMDNFDGSIGNRRAALVLLQEAQKLERLKMQDFCASDLTGEQMASFASTFLLAGQYQCLREVQLFHSMLYSSDIVTFLQRAKSTLEKFQLHGYLFGSERRWIDILKELQECKKLRYLTINGGFGGELQEIVDGHHHDCSLRMPRDAEDKKWRHSIEGVQAILALTVKEPILEEVQEL